MDKPDDDLIARFRDLCNETGGLTEDELAEVKLVGQENLVTERAVRRRGPCIRCKTPLRYGKLSKPHLARGDQYLDQLAKLFANVPPERLTVAFSRWYQSSNVNPWREHIWDVLVNPPGRRAAQGYCWTYLIPYVCSHCRKEFEAIFDQRWAVWVEQVLRERKERERESAKQKQQDEKDQQRRENKRERRRRQRQHAKERRRQALDLKPIQ